MAQRLLLLTSVDRGVIATATELFEGRHFPGVVAMCTDALEDEPECVPLLVIRARAHIALRRDLEAQADLRDIIRLDPTCALAYRLLGELAARRNANESASIFFREALRLDPGDREAADWLLVTDASIRPAAAAQKLPAPAAAAGRQPSARASARPAHEPRSQNEPRSSSAHEPRSQNEPRSEAARHDSTPRFARGTQNPAGEAPRQAEAVPLRWGDVGMHDERPTRPFARGSERNGGQWAGNRTSSPLPPPDHQGIGQLASVEVQPRILREQTQELDEEVIPLVVPKHGELATIRGRPQTNTPPAKPAPRMTPRPVTRNAMPELPGFGEYLVSTGILTRERLRAAQAYQRSMKVQLSTAIVTLGLATPQRIEWASVAHQSQRSRSER